MKRTILTAILATTAGLLAGSVTAGTSASAEGDSPSADGIYLGGSTCENRVDTNCAIFDKWPASLGPRVVRFTDEGKFCTLRKKTPQAERIQRCEDYWPFHNPVITR